MSLYIEEESMDIRLDIDCRQIATGYWMICNVPMRRKSTCY